jgi:hypothetical protein
MDDADTVSIITSLLRMYLQLKNKITSWMDGSEANYRSCDQTYAVHFINVHNI